MKVATLLYTYKRFEHTKKVLEALSQNDILPEKLIIFQDGIKENSEREGWDKVNLLIRGQAFCHTEIIVSETNKGLARSVTDGVYYALKDSEAVIVLEDDCVPARSFMRYMYDMLRIYENESRVWGISGYAWPGISSGNEKEDIYFGGRVSSWGWATWKNRWEKYKKDIDIINRIRKNCKDSLYLSRWGNDLESMMKGQIRGENDSWAVFWALNMIEDKGLFVMPYKSRIRNIGLDGSGENCSSDSYNIYNVDLDHDICNDYTLPKKISIDENAQKKIKPLFGSYIADQERDNAKTSIIVYGIGRCLLDNEEKIVRKYNVSFFADSYKRGYHAGKKILNPGELKEEMKKGDLDILITMYDDREVVNIKSEMISFMDVDPNRILSWKEL